MTESVTEALNDAVYAFTNLIEVYDLGGGEPADEACTAVELCGHAICDECGCLKDKRDRAAQALSSLPSTPNVG